MKPSGDLHSHADSQMLTTDARQASSQTWTRVGRICCQFNRTMARSPKFVLALLIMVFWLASPGNPFRSLALFFFRDILMVRSSSSLGVEESISTCAAPSFPSTATPPGSWCWLYGLWQSGQLTGLADVGDCTHAQQYLSPSSSASPRSHLSDFLSIVSPRVVGVPSRLHGSCPAPVCASVSLSVASPAAGLVESALSGATPRDTTPRKVPRTSEFPSFQLQLERQESRKSERQMQPISLGSGGMKSR